MRNRFWVVLLGFVMSLFIDSLALAQGLQSSPYAAPSLLRRDSLGLAPTTSFDRSYTNGRIPPEAESRLMGASSQKDVPNLQAGYVNYFGKNWRVGYFTLDYILPIRLDENSIIFGEAHSELQAFSTRAAQQSDDQVYLSLGGGYRSVLRKTILVGVNGFYDAARFANKWLSSGGAGFEMATLLHGHDALDMHFNWYGDLSNEGPLMNENRDGLANFDLQLGYSHQLWDRGPDLRLYGTAYKFDDSGGVFGWQAGFELKSANGVFSAKCETANDPVNDSYQTVGAFVNIGFQFENLLKGRNPFVMPEPIFNSPRNMNRLTEKVKRHWRHTTHGLALASNKTITVINKRSAPMTLYMGFIGAIGWGKYTAKDFPGFSVAPASCNGQGNVLYLTLNPAGQNGDTVVINFDPTKGQVSPAFSADRCTWNCTPSTPQTLAEFTLQGGNSRDYVDISLVNGFNYPMEIASSVSGSPPVQVIRVDSSTGNKNKTGVFPLYCDACNASKVPGCTFPPNQSECSPDNLCQVNFPTGANYVVSILPN